MTAADYSAAPLSFADAIVADPIGRFPGATVACFDPTTGELPRRSLDAPRMREFLRRLASAGADALLIGASTGHGHVRTFDELAAWFEAAAVDLGACVRTALLRPEDDLESNLRLIRRLPALGYPVVFFRPGTDRARIGRSQDAIDASVESELRPLVAAAASAGLAVGVYSIPDVSGVKLTPNVVAKLLDAEGGDRLVAVKVTEASYDESTRRFLDHPRLSRLKIVQGWDPHLARALQEGGRRCGVTSGPMSFAVHQYRHLLSAAARGDWQEVALAQSAVTALFAAMQDDPNRFADLQRAKFLMGLGHPMTGTADAAAVERVLATLRSLPRVEDRRRLASSLNLLENGPFAEALSRLATA